MLPAALKYFKRSKTSRIFMNDELNKQWYIVQKKIAIKNDAVEEKNDRGRWL